MGVCINTKNLRRNEETHRGSFGTPVQTSIDYQDRIVVSYDFEWKVALHESVLWQTREISNIAIKGFTMLKQKKRQQQNVTVNEE